MHYSEIYKWITQERNRKSTLISIQQPLTAKQLSRITCLGEGTCSYLLGRFADLQLCVCLNPKATNSRLYWLTDIGRKLQNNIKPDINLTMTHLPALSWEVYGWLCFSHRSIVVRALSEPMQPAAIRRKIRKKFSHAKISANNIRDIIKLFEKKGLVERIFVKKKAHPLYALTETGLLCQNLLNQVEFGFQFNNGKVQKNTGRESKRYSCSSKETIMGKFDPCNGKARNSSYS